MYSRNDSVTTTKLHSGTDNALTVILSFNIELDVVEIFDSRTFEVNVSALYVRLHTATEQVRNDILQLKNHYHS